MKIEKKKEIIEIQEEVKLPQKDNDLILEKGDRIEVLKEEKLIDSKNIRIELEEILSEYVGLIEEPDSWTTNDFKYIEVLKFMIGFCAEKLQNLKFSNYVEVDKESSILINKPISLFRKFYKDLL